MATTVQERPARVAPRRRRRRWFIVVVVAVCGLLAAEVGARALAPRLPPPLAWHSFEAQKKVQRMDELGTAGGVDVVFLGTSMMHTALRAADLERLLGGGVRAYNASLSSSIPRQTEQWTMEVVVPRLRPRLVVIGLTSFELTDTSPMRTAFFDAFMGSRAARQELGRGTVLERADRWLRRVSAFWEHRFELRRPRLVYDALRGRAEKESAEVAAIGADGRTTYLSHQQFEDRARDAGVPVGQWAPGTEDVGALERLLRRLHDGGISVALVSMPVTEEYIARHPNAAADYDRFHAILTDLAARTSTPVLDVDIGRNHVLFADEVHLNDSGSRRFTEAMAAALRSSGLLEHPRNRSGT